MRFGANAREVNDVGTRLGCEGEGVGAKTREVNDSVYNSQKAMQIQTSPLRARWA